jgi:hypothetical protein
MVKVPNAQVHTDQFACCQWLLRIEVSQVLVPRGSKFPRLKFLLYKTPMVKVQIYQSSIVPTVTVKIPKTQKGIQAYGSRLLWVKVP